MEKDVPGLRDPMSGPYNLKDAIRRLAVSKGQLEKLGVNASPEAVARWRDAKLAAHKERARVLRELMAHPDRAQTLYETTSSSAIVYGRWLAWTLNYRTEERIAAWENQPAVGRFRFDLTKGTGPPLWMLLESMVEEQHNLGRPRASAYSEVLSVPDIEMLRSLGRAWSEDLPDMLAFKPGLAVSAEARAMLDSMISSTYLGGFEKDLMKAVEREYVEKAKVEILAPAPLAVKAQLSNPGPGEMTRAQLLAPMTVPEAIEALSEYNGRLTIGMLTLAKAGPRAVPALLERLKVKETRGLGHVLVLLKWLDAREALAVVRERALWKSADEGTMNGSLGLLAKFEPASLETVVAEAVAEFEAQPTYAGIGASYAPPPLRRAAFYLAKYRPNRARQVLIPYLSSPKPGVRFAAGRALADLGDDSGVKYALEFLEQAPEHDRYFAIDIIERVGGLRGARGLDGLALRLKAPALAVSARDIEFGALPADRRWAYVKKYLGDQNKNVDYWAFRKVEEGFQGNAPGVGPILEYAAGMKGTAWQQRAQELSTYQARKQGASNSR